MWGRLGAGTRQLATWPRPSAAIDGLLDEIRKIRQVFDADEALASSHVMALANAAAEADSQAILARNESLLTEVRIVSACVERYEFSVGGMQIGIMAQQYVGLLHRSRYEEAARQLSTMSQEASGGSCRGRLEWLTAVRTGFWILLERRDYRRVSEQIELVRDFRRRHPDDNYEAPHALLAMLLGAFADAEERGDIASADAWFDEACSLGSEARDDYGRLSIVYQCLSRGMLGTPSRGAVLAERLAAIWQLKH